MKSYVEFLEETIIEAEILAEKVDISPMEANVILKKFSSSEYFKLSFSELDDLVTLAKQNKYRKSKTAPGSTSRMFFQYLQKIANRK